MPVQLRLGFAPAAREFRLHLSLSGLMVHADVQGVSEEVAASLLAGQGLPVTVRGEWVVFPVAELLQVSKLDESITVTVDGSLTALWDLVRNPSMDGTPVEVVMDSPGRVHLRWFDGAVAHVCELAPEATAALLALEVPFVAGHEAFDYLRDTCNLPILAGRARVNLDGFIEISSSKPQLAETAPIPGLFRVNATTLGVPLAYASAVSAAPGFVWDGPTPVPSEYALEQLSAPLTEHAAAELSSMAYDLATTRARVIAWPAGLGRRFFSLASAASLGALPVLVVANPEYLWPWQRHAQQLGLSSGTGQQVDVTVVTYQMVLSGFAYPAGSVIFDSLSSALDRWPALRKPAQSLAGVSDALRIDVEPQWQLTEAQQLAVMSVVRPAEFDTDLPASLRYPGDPRKRFAEHVACYLSVRDAQPSPGLGEFKTSSVTVVHPSEELLEKMDTLRHSAAPAAVRLTDLLELVSCGSAHILGPKISAAVSSAIKSASQGRAIAVLTNHPRTAQLISSALRGSKCRVVDARALRSLEATEGVTVVLYERTMPILSAFQDALIVDYPWSSAVIDDAVGSAALQGGCQHVEVIHLRDSLDDRLAQLASHRRDARVASSHSMPPTQQEISWLLS